MIPRSRRSDPYALGIDDHRPTSSRRDRRSRLRVRTALAGGALLLALVSPGCSDLMGSEADVVVQLEVEDQPSVMRVRQDALDGAAAWGGVRVGETSADLGDSALEFTLPGENLDIALGAISDLDARVVSTEIDVEAQQISRTTTSAPAAGGRSDSTSGDNAVRLRVEVAQAPSAGPDGLLRTVMAVFSVIGVIATFRWVRDLLDSRRNRSSGPPQRSIERVDLRDDPPTQETPRIPPSW